MTNDPRDRRRRFLSAGFLVAIFTASYFPASYVRTSFNFAPAWQSLLMIALTVMALVVGAFLVPLTAADRAAIEQAERAAAEEAEPRCHRCDARVGDVTFRCPSCGTAQHGGRLILFMLAALVITLALLFSGALN